MTAPRPPVTVIFGAAVLRDGSPSETMRHRVEAAANCAASAPETLFIPTGAVGRYGPSEASVMARLLMDLGISPDRILLEETGVNTVGSARAVVRLLRLHRLAGPVRVATSAYHMPRCLLLLRCAGVDAHACPAPLFRASRNPWKRWYWRLREIPAVPLDAALMLFLRVAGRV